MLAQSFLSHDVLRITEQDRDALVKVLGMLEREEIPYAPGDRWISQTMRVPLTHFNMQMPNGEHECGSAGCLLGWAKQVAGDYWILRRGRTMALNDLFCMSSHGGHRGKFSEEITPSEAASALRNYLTLGEPRWQEVLHS